MTIKRLLNLRTLLYLTVIVILSSCQATSFLKKDQTFLRKNTIKFESHEKIEGKIFIEQELSTLYNQKPNKSILHVPKQWFYYVTKNKTGWFVRFIKKFFAEPPSIFDLKKTKRTTAKFEEYLKNNKGFYNAKVEFKTYKTKYLTDVDYIIKTGRRHHINSVKYECNDSILFSIIKEIKDDSYLKVGDPINSHNYNSEKTRIANELQNRGYALFNQNYIELFGDSTNLKVDLTVVIHNFNENSNHEKYKIGKVNVYTDYYPGQSIDILDTTIVNGITFYKELDQFLVKPSILSDVVTIKLGQLYEKRKTREIYDKLSDFRIYRFVSIRTSVDTSHENTINYLINLNTQKKRNYREGNIVLNYATLSRNIKFIELEGSGIIMNRNLSDRGDNLAFSGSGDVKINLSKEGKSEYNILSRLDYNNPISPKTIKFSPLYLYYNKLKKKKYSEIKNSSSTKSSLSYQYQIALKNYSFSSFNYSYGYNYTPNANLIIRSNQIGVNYYAPEILNDSIFSIFQKKSMKKVFITGLLLKNFAIDYISNNNKRLLNYKLFFGLETSGAEIFVFNKLYSSIFRTNEKWSFNDEIKYSKFIKANIDFRPQLKLGTTSLLVGRVYLGIGLPYGDSDILPYTKQFAVGGPNSMRAWAARELGPGSYKHTASDIFEIPYQKGDLRIETNLEYRFKVSYLIKSALFIDAGNIWTLKYDKEREGSLFTKNFLDQIAIDAGVSLQLDVIVLLRLDFAYKLRTPYKNENQNNWGFDLTRPSVVFAINHPF